MCCLSWQGKTWAVISAICSASLRRGCGQNRSMHGRDIPAIFVAASMSELIKNCASFLQGRALCGLGGQFGACGVQFFIAIDQATMAFQMLTVELHIGGCEAVKTYFARHRADSGLGNVAAEHAR